MRVDGQLKSTGLLAIAVVDLLESESGREHHHSLIRRSLVNNALEVGPDKITVAPGSQGVFGNK